MDACASRSQSGTPIAPPRWERPRCRHGRWPEKNGYPEPDNRFELRYWVARLPAAPPQWALPSVADRRDPTLARGPAAVAEPFASCDRRRTVRRCDYAILPLLARLALRACEAVCQALGLP
jgi:hypothetical protein